MMKTVKHLSVLCHCRQRINFHRGACCVLEDALSSAASELGNQNSTTQEGGWSLASLTNLLSSGNQALSADNMNNAAGILQYCAKQKLASVTDAENIKNQVLEKLGLNSEEQKRRHQLSGRYSGFAENQRWSATQSG
ncbi:putative glycoprotein/receptor [Escherichia coli]|uniref:Putative glycoprotein/receptor n=1 Tax=Escherichia coli TaxID=562 RepID=A0A377AP13_ECOLX|nr:putative glycoprotein/receptor [Escherichia coli]